MDTSMTPPAAAAPPTPPAAGGAQLTRDQRIRMSAVGAAARVTAATLSTSSQYAPPVPGDALVTLADQIAAYITSGELRRAGR
jgi:hypothetical protein